MQIREIRAEDAAAARAIWNEVVVAGDAFPQTDALTDDREALGFFRGQTRTAVAVDETTEQMLGLYILHPNNIGRCAHIANASYAVTSTARGQGVGRALVEDSIASLAPCGFTGLQFNAVVASNAGAIALYEKLGFMRVGTIPGGFRNAAGAYEDIHIFYHAASAPEPAAAPPHVEAAPVPSDATVQPSAIPVLECRDLTKRYGAACGLDRVSLALPAGRIVGLLGPNGSGKTTLMKLAAGLLQPTTGTILVDGRAPGAETKAQVSYLPERPYFAPSMRVCATLDFFADFYADFDRALAERMLADLSVPLSAPMATLSKGTKEKVQLVLVMARHARLYLLDEPIGGVDPATRDYILRTIIGSYRRDATLLVSTHLVDDVEDILDDVVILGAGTVLECASASELRARSGMKLDEYFRRRFAC